MQLSKRERKRFLFNFLLMPQQLDDEYQIHQKACDVVSTAYSTASQMNQQYHIAENVGKAAAYTYDTAKQLNDQYQVFYQSF